MITLTIKIEHEKFGTILNENFVNEPVQHKLFLQMIHGCLELGNDLTFFDGNSFLIHIPHKHLKDSIIITKFDVLDMTNHMKSKVKPLQTA